MHGCMVAQGFFFFLGGLEGSNPIRQKFCQSPHPTFVPIFGLRLVPPAEVRPPNFEWFVNPNTIVFLWSRNKHHLQYEGIQRVHTLRKPGSNIRVVFQIILFWSFKGHFWSNLDRFDPFSDQYLQMDQITSIIFDPISGSFYFDPLRVTFDPIWIVLIRFRINIYKWIKFTRIIFDLISGSKLWSVFLDHFDSERMSWYLILCLDQKWSFLSHIWSWLSKSDSRKCIHTIISPDLPTASRGRVVRAMVS